MHTGPHTDLVPRTRLWRSRWAAIGAAVAVTLGAGGLATSFAAGSPSSLVAISPIRVLDTRLEAMGPSLTSGAPRLLDVTGQVPTVGADGVTVANAVAAPDGATAIVANVTIVSPTTAGFVAVRPGDATGTPTTSSLNATAPGVIVPNSVTVAIPTSGTAAGQIQLWFQGAAPAATTHLLVDVVGYYQDVAAGPRGASAWDTIPSGQTVSGEFVHIGSAAGIVAEQFSIDFPAVAPVALVNTTANSSADFPVTTLDEDSTCTGTYAAPTAPPGRVCVYLQSEPLGYANVRVDALAGLPTHGFRVRASPTAAGEQTALVLTWAYTAP